MMDLLVQIGVFTLVAISVGAQTDWKTPLSIWDATATNNVNDIHGLGGRYGFMSNKFLSKKNLIESDHFPPKSSYPNAKDANIKNLSDDDMAAVTMSFEFHRQFFTTYNNRKSLKLMEDFFKAGNYYGAIDTNIGWYLSNPQRKVHTGTEASVGPTITLTHPVSGKQMQGNAKTPGMINWLKEGILAGLEIHVINRLITLEQKLMLIKKHGLEAVDTAIPRRQAAIKFLVGDMKTYRISARVKKLWTGSQVPWTT